MLGDHHGEDFICGLNLEQSSFNSWNYRIPCCPAGWSACAGEAHSQMLFVSDGIESGKMPTNDLDQSIMFWLGPEGGTGPQVSIGPRPRAHSDAGHARAILSAARPPLSLVVCNDGILHLIDPIDYCYLEQQDVSFPAGYRMPNFAAQVDPNARQIFIGVATGEPWFRGLVERIIVHDPMENRRLAEWELKEPLCHMVLTTDGRFLFGVVPSGSLGVFDTRSGKPAAVMELGGMPQCLVPAQRQVEHGISDPKPAIV